MKVHVRGRLSVFVCLRLPAAWLLATFLVTSGASAQVSVSATAGIPGPTPYPTLGAAFTAINVGVHQGAITIGITGNTLELVTAALNNSGAGLASYTSVLIRPTVAATITGDILGAVIKLNGADNVTIDGRIGGVGTARSLTITNTNASTATGVIWLASVALGNGASNDVIRNLELAGGADQQASTASTFGIVQTGAVISGGAGNDNDNNQFVANRIVRVRYGIVSRGVTTNNNIAPIVTDNIIGPEAFGSDQIGKAGIYMQADTGAVISRNKIQYVGALATNPTTSGDDRFGIAIGAETWSVTETATSTSGDYTITRNVIHDIVDEKAFSSVGIRLGTTRGSNVATNNLVANNVIFNIRSDGADPDQFAGIGYVAGHTDRIVFNSISIIGDMDPPGAQAASIFGSGIRLSAANSASNMNLTLKNNSITLDASSNNATRHFYAITLNSAAYAFGTGGGLDRNNYFINTANPQVRTGGLAAVSGGAATAEFLTLAAWQAALTTPQDASSIQSDPLSFADYHLQPASPNIDGGTAIGGVTEDFDGEVRPNGAGLDIGADEFYSNPGTLQFSAASYSASETAGSATITVTRAVGSNGVAQVNYATVAGGTATGGAACDPGVDFINVNGDASWGDLDATPRTFTVTLCPDGLLEPSETVNLALTDETGASLGAPSTAVLRILDSASTLSGTLSVGTGQLFTSLTNAGGVFETINGNVVTGNLTIDVVSDLTAETGVIALNEFAAPFSVLIRPSGAARTITGTSITFGLIKLNGADSVTIDGSLTGGTDRSLTITNGNPAAAVIWIASASSTNSASGDTVKNCVISGAPGVVASAGLLSGGGTVFGNGADSPNSNNTIQNNQILRVRSGVLTIGNNGALRLDQNWLITGNTLGSTLAADKIILRGVGLGGAQNFEISNNTIRGVVATIAPTLNVGGIQLTGTLNGGAVFGNRISDVRQNIAVLAGAAGITLNANGLVTPSNVSVFNNFIWDVAAQGAVGSTVNDNGYGIMVVSGGGYRIRYNTVSMGLNQVAAGSITAAINIAPAVTAAGAIDLRDNIFTNTQTVGTRYAIFVGSPVTIFSAIDFNDYFSSQSVGFLASARASLANWQTATGQDASSKAVDPLLVSASDLHLQTLTPLAGMATPIAGIATDIDNQSRNALAPEIGADEISVAELLVTNVGTPDPVAPGDALAYTITVTNAGPDPAVTVAWSDVLPTGTTFVSLGAPAEWTCTPLPIGTTGTVSCATPSLEVGSAVFTLTVAVAPSVPAGTILSNTASATSATPDQNPGNESATATTTVSAFADLSVTNLDAPDPVRPGNNLTYTISVINAGPNNAAFAVLTDTLPAETTFVSLASPAGWSCTTPPSGGSGMIACSIPVLSLGTSGFTLVVNVDSGVASGSVLSNTATIASSTPDPNPGNENGTATTIVTAAADLSVATLATPDPVAVGAYLGYTITVTNGGPNAAATTSLSDTLPAGTTFVSLTSSAGWSCTTPPVGASGTVACSISSLGAGSAIFRLTAKVDALLAVGTVLSNIATVSSATTDPNPGNESGSASTTVSGLADISVFQDVDDPAPALGSDVTFSIAVNNLGPTAATGVQVTDLLPSGLTYVSDTPSVGTYNSATGVWTIGPLANGASAMLSLVATVSRPEALVNQVTKTAQGEADPDASNNALLLGLNGPPLADMQVHQMVSDATPGVGTTVTLLVSAMNAGPAPATGIELTDLLPASLTFVSANASQGTYVPETGLWTVGALGRGMGAALQIAATVSSTAPISNVVSKTAETESDYVTGNDAASITLNGTTLADLSLSNMASQEPVANGIAFTYTLAVANDGPAVATGVTVVDDLPAGVSFVLATPSQGACVGTTSISCSLGTMSAGATAQIAVVVTKTTGGPVSNVAAVSANEDDPYSANNSNGEATTPVELMGFEID